MKNPSLFHIFFTNYFETRRKFTVFWLLCVYLLKCKGLFLKGKIPMKIAKGLMPFLLFIFMSVTLLTGCSHVDKTDVEAVITNELDLLKNLDSATTQKYVSYKELFPDTKSNYPKKLKKFFLSFSRILIIKSRMLMSTTIKKKPTFPCSFLHWMPGHLPKIMRRHLLKLPF